MNVKNLPNSLTVSLSYSLMNQLNETSSTLIQSAAKVIKIALKSFLIVAALFGDIVFVPIVFFAKWLLIKKTSFNDKTTKKLELIKQNNSTNSTKWKRKVQ